MAWSVATTRVSAPARRYATDIASRAVAALSGPVGGTPSLLRDSPAGALARGMRRRVVRRAAALGGMGEPGSLVGMAAAVCLGPLPSLPG